MLLPRDNHNGQSGQRKKVTKNPRELKSMLCGRTEPRENVSDLVARGLVVDLHLTG